MNIIDFIKQPWPWWVSGPLIGLMVPALLMLGNKPCGVSSSMKHICAACFPANISFFKYDWKKESWNLFFVTDFLIGAFVGWTWLSDHQIVINEKLLSELRSYGINDHNQLVPIENVNWITLFSLKGILMIVVGGFLVGFGTRYADGCTSGHSIMGLANLQFPALIAACSFMAGGFFSANVLVPLQHHRRRSIFLPLTLSAKGFIHKRVVRDHKFLVVICKKPHFVNILNTNRFFHSRYLLLTL